MHPSLPEKTKRHPKTYTKRYKVRLQNKFYNELLKTQRPPKYVPEEGEIVETFKIPKQDENDGLEHNYSDILPTQLKLSRLQSELVRLEQHHLEQNLKNLTEMPRNKADPGVTNNNWIITHRPTNAERHLCDICGVSFSYKCTLVRHKDLHSNKTHICPHCNYSSTRVDNIRRHLRRFHKITETAPLIVKLDTIVNTPTKPKPKVSAPEKDKKIMKISIPSNRRHEPNKTLKKMKWLNSPDGNHTKMFYTKPVTKPPIWNKPHMHSDTPPPPPPPPPPSPPSEASLVDLTWLPIALSSPGHPPLPDSLEQPEISPVHELGTPIVNNTPIQDQWNILDEIGATEEISSDLQAC